MKAVIMAGGEGTRLRPVSLGLPKPMVKLFDRPALAHIIGLLREYGVTEACLTLKYMPGVITEYIESKDFGLKLHTKIEEVALGTAGGVKNCTDFIGNDDFIVISGDCVCDFNLKALMEHHKSKNAEVTIALYEHPEPLEYGLVVTRGDGRIEKFIEKPPWENVVTNRVNTGIYIISPAVLRDIPDGVSYDFGKDLFPALLAENRALYGLPMDGYWCDIGSPGAYLQCCADILQGKVRFDIGTPLVREGVYSHSPIPDDAVIIPPVYVGSGVRIKPGANLGPHAIIGEGSEVAATASVIDSAVDGAAVLEGASVTGAIICKGTVVGRGASVREEAVIGEGCIIGDNAVVAQAVKLWPDRKIQPGLIVKSDITHGMLNGGPEFTSRGVISGDIGAEITPAAALKLGEAAGGIAKRVGIGFGGGAAARVISEAIGSGICAAGGSIVRFDSGLPSCVSFTAASLMMPLSICVNQTGGRAALTFFGANGCLPSNDFERKLLAHSGAVFGADGYGVCEYFHGAAELYAAAAARYGGTHSGTPPQVAVIGGGERNRVLRRALTLLGCDVLDENDTIPGFEAGDGGMSLYAICEDGRRLTPEQMLTLAAHVELSRGRHELLVPLDAPEVIDALARRRGATVCRIGRDGVLAGMHELPSLRDGVFMCALICGFMREKGISLSGLFDEIPKFSLATKELRLRGSCGEVMAVLSAAACEAGAELTGGVGMRLKDGYVRVSPLRGGDRLRIRSEAEDSEIAEELCADMVRRIKEIDGLTFS